HEGWSLGCDRVAVVKRDPADQVQALERSGEDGDVVRACLDAAVGQTLDDDLPQRWKTLAWSVRQNSPTVFADCSRERALERLDRVRLGRRLTATEADQVRADAD